MDTVVDFILNSLGAAIFYVGRFLLSLLPPAQHLPTGVTEGIQSIFNYLYMFDFLVPVTTVLTLLGIAVSFQIVLGMFRFAYMIIRVIRG